MECSSAVLRLGEVLDLEPQGMTMLHKDSYSATGCTMWLQGQATAGLGGVAQLLIFEGIAQHLLGLQKNKTLARSVLPLF